MPSEHTDHTLEPTNHTYELDIHDRVKITINNIEVIGGVTNIDNESFTCVIMSHGPLSHTQVTRPLTDIIDIYHYDNNGLPLS